MALSLVLLTGTAKSQPMAVDLPVPLVHQDTLEWCWMAAAEMILRFKGIAAPRQCEIMEQGHHAPPGSCCLHPAACTRAGNVFEIQNIIAAYGGGFSQLGPPANPIWLANLLRAGSPVIAHLQLPTGGHFVVIRGIRWAPSRMGPVPLVKINDPIRPFPFEMPFAGLVGIWDAGIYVQPGSFHPPFASHMGHGPLAGPMGGPGVSSSGIEGALEQLLGAAPGRFAAFRGAAEPREADDSVTFYRLSLPVPGLADCTIQVDDDPTTSPSVVCHAYRGNDDAAARARYRELADRVTRFASTHGGSASETVRDTGTHVLQHIVQTEFRAANGSSVRASYVISTYSSTGHTDRTVKLWVDAP